MIVAMQDTDGNRYIWDELLRQWVPVTGAMSPAELAAEMAPTLRSQYVRTIPTTSLGATDDAATIQAVIDDATANGGPAVVRLPYGSWNLATLLRVKKNVTLDMQGATFELTASGACVVVDDLGSSVRNGLIDGNSTATNGLVVRRGNATQHRDLVVKSCTGVGVLFDTAYSAGGGAAGNNNHCAMMNVLSTANTGAGFGANGLQSDNNGLRFIECGGTLNGGDGIKVRGIQWRIDGGDWTYNTGYGITVGDAGDASESGCDAYRPWLEGNTAGGINPDKSLRSCFTVDRYMPQFPTLPSGSNDVVLSVGATTGGLFGVQSASGQGVFLRGYFGGGVVESAVTNSFLRVSGNGTGGLILGESSGNNRVSFYGATPVVKPTVTGSRGANAALQSLLSALATLGLITDSSS